MKFSTHSVLIASLLLTITQPFAVAEENHVHRQHGAHVHGAAQLNLAIVNTHAEITLVTPAANIVGFEHLPSSEADHRALEQAVATLSEGARLFRFNDEAQCQLMEADITSPMLEAGKETENHAAAHDREQEHEHHAEHDKEHEHHAEHDKEHEHHAEHGNEETHEETHSEMEAHYRFNCARPGKLTLLRVNIFDVFPETHRLDVQYIFNDKQGARDLDAEHRVISF